MTSSYAAAPTKDRILRNGKPYFYLADTVWSAFTKAPMPVSFVDGKTVFGMPAYNADALIIIHR
ncbi:MAG: hypothetical protein AABZ39_15180 [Spirochaetota bacterium]